MTRIEVVQHCFVFQKGVILKLAAGPANGGYQVPDMGDGSAGMIPSSFVKPISTKKASTGASDGKCLLTSVSNYFAGREKQNEAVEDVVLAGRVSVFHYSDAQKIVFHLPRPARLGNRFQLIDRVTGEVIEQKPLIDKANGNTMIMVDTMELTPGFYLIRADWPGGWTHDLTFIKYPAGFPNSQFPNPPEHIKRLNNGEEHHLATPLIVGPTAVKLPARPEEKIPAHSPNLAQQQNLGKNGYWVSYTQDGRGGNVYYHEKDLTISFWWEFAGGSAVAMIGIPEEKYWEPQTGTPLSRRSEILERLGAQVVQDQAAGGDFEVYFNSISIFSSKLSKTKK